MNGLSAGSGLINRSDVAFAKRFLASPSGTSTWDISTFAHRVRAASAVPDSLARLMSQIARQQRQFYRPR